MKGYVYCACGMLEVWGRLFNQMVLNIVLFVSGSWTKTLTFLTTDQDLASS